jgi:hypothetical protein
MILCGGGVHATEDQPHAVADEGPLLAIPSPVGTLTYTPGRGLHLGNTGVTLGGYSDVTLTRDDGSPAKLDLDTLSLFVIWDPHPRLHVFSELEFEHLVSVDDEGRAGTERSHFNAERLYADVTVSDLLGIRLGKFLTPVGRWNVLHASPLVWTTSRPLVTLLPFDTHTTGPMLSGSVTLPRGDLGYAVYGQLTQLDRQLESEESERGGGARLEYTTSDEWSVGASYLGFARRSFRRTPGNGRWQNLVGLDTLWRHGPLELMGEFAHEEDQTGLYLQEAFEILPRVFAVGRYEYYVQATPNPAVNLGVGGLAWKPLPYLVLKAEYLFADHRVEESPAGVKSSVAVLF